MKNKKALIVIGVIILVYFLMKKSGKTQASATTITTYSADAQSLLKSSGTYAAGIEDAVTGKMAVFSNEQISAAAEAAKQAEETALSSGATAIQAGIIGSVAQSNALAGIAGLDVVRSYVNPGYWGTPAQVAADTAAITASNAAKEAAYVAAVTANLKNIGVNPADYIIDYATQSARKK